MLLSSQQFIRYLKTQSLALASEFAPCSSNCDTAFHTWAPRHVRKASENSQQRSHPPALTAHNSTDRSHSLGTIHRRSKEAKCHVLWIAKLFQSRLDSDQNSTLCPLQHYCLLGMKELSNAAYLSTPPFGFQRRVPAFFCNWTWLRQ